MKTDGLNLSVVPSVTISTSINSSEDDMTVSDLGSDVEPEELLSAHLSAKSRLYKLRPDLVTDTITKKNNSKQVRSSKKNADEDQPISAGILKLQKKLKQIESDVLFDPQEADAQWTLRRNQLIQEAASRRRFALTDDSLSRQPRSPRKSAGTLDAGSGSEQNNEVELRALDGEDDSGEEDILGGMFSALPDETAAPTEDGSSGPVVVVTIRDFGKFVGVSPRRVLEEACRSR